MGLNIKENRVVGITYSKGQILQDTYQIVDEIGEGGAGVIYLAIHLRLQKYVVVKKIKEGVVGRMDTRKEVDMLKSLHHKFLPQVYDFFQEGSDVYTVLDYIEGNDLAFYIHNGYRVPEELIIKWLLELTEVLEYLHTMNPPIIHSDIKPSNIIITPNMDVCLIDFNISMSDGTSTVTGVTPAYSSPEQIAQSMGYPVPIDSRTDIYSLGASFYHVMTFTKPHLTKNEPLDYSSMYEFYRTSLIDVIKIAMNQRPDNRFQTVKEMHKAIEKTTKEYRLKKIRNILLASLGVLIILGATAGIMLHGNKKKEQLVRAYSADYNAVVNEYNSETYEPTELRECVENNLLNNEEYEKILEQKSDQYAELKYIIGYTYYLEGNYESAISSYKEALDTDKENGNIYRELSVCYSRTGDFSNAKYYVDKADEKELDSADIALMQAELSLARGEYTESIEFCRTVCDSSPSDEMLMRSAMTCSEASESLETYADFIELYRGIDISDTESIKLDRLLRNACMYEGDRQIEDISKNSFYNQSLIYGERVVKSADHTVEDEVTLAKAYTYLEMYDNARNLLNESAFIDEDYRIYMWLACVEYKSSGESTLNMIARTYYDMAKKMESYNIAVNKGTVDPIMEQLGEL